jgi:MFS family permease
VANALATFRSSFSPLRHPNFRLYIGGQAVSLIGTWLQITALGWVVWRLTGSEVALGTVNMLNTLPLLFVTPYAGVLADRIDRRKLLIGAQMALMLAAFLIAFLTQTGLIQLWHIYGIALATGVIAALDLPAQQAFLGDLSGMGEVRKAVNMNAMIIQISRMLGPAIAGLVVARLGAAPAFWLNGLSFLVVIGSLLLVRAAQAQPPLEKAQPVQQLREGLAFVRTQPRIVDLFAFALMITFFAWAVVFNVLPSVADEVLRGDAETLGVLMSASGAGALFGVLFVVPLAQAYRRPGLAMSAAATWTGFFLVAAGVSNTLVVTALALALGSVGVPVTMTIGLGLTQLMAPPEMRARVISLFTMISFGLQPLAAFFVGTVAETFGVQTAIVLNGTLLISAAALILALRPGLRTWEVKAKPSEPAEPALSPATGD